MKKRRTDADRRNIRIGCPNIDFCWNPTTREFAERYSHLARKGATNFFDAYQPLYYQQLHGETPFVYDLRRGQTEAVIAYVNAQADDYNCICQDATKPVMFPCRVPSLQVADLFSVAVLSYAADTNQSGSPEAVQQHLDDLLYIYGALKKRGLNQEAVAAFQKQWPEVTLPAIFNMMDKYLARPEETRWNTIAQDAPDIKRLVSPGIARMKRQRWFALNMRT